MLNLVWVTKDKRRLLLSEMEVKHLQNCLNMLLKKPPTVARCIMANAIAEHLQARIQDERDQRIHEEAMQELAYDSIWGENP